MNLERIRTFSYSLLFLTFIFLAGCQTQEHASDSESPYEWAQSLQEGISTVPPVPDIIEQPLTSPSDETYLSKHWPWGNPKDLTQPISGSEHTLNSRSRSPTATNKSKRPSTQSGSNSIVVNVNQTQTDDSSDKSENTQSKQTSTSRLESLYRGQFDKKASRELIQFGYDFFDEGPINSNELSGPVPRTYLIGNGDEIILSISGTVDAYHRLSVDRDGMINIPEFGAASVAGLSYEELQPSLNRFLEERRSGFELTVNLGRLRQIQVNVIGRVKQPGIVTIPALGTPLNALLAAGGPNKDGSLRKIILRRANHTKDKSIDLYTYLRGQNSLQPFPHLEDGDTIQVTAIGPTIGVAGYVQQPAIYELSSTQSTVEEAIQIAGGLTPFSFTPLAHLEKTVNGRGRVRTDISLTTEGMRQKMGNGELLLVEAVDDDRQPIVRIMGEIARPGDYEHRIGMRLSDLIKSADGLTIDAYLPQVLISRQLGKTDTIENVPERTGHLQSRRILVTDLAKAIEGDPKHDIVLMPLDLVTVRTQKAAQVGATVEIIGSVQRPGKYELTAGMRVSDLVAIAGNPTPDVYYDEAELIRRVLDDQTRRLDVKRYRFNLQKALQNANTSDYTLNPVLSNGDQLVIRALQQAQVRVRIDGLVRFPGEYVFPAGKTITDLVAAAGGILPGADMRAAAFTRLRTKQLQQKRLNNLLERSRRLNESAFERLVQTGQPREALAGKISLEQTLATINRMQKVEADGRIVIPFDTPDFPKSNFNLTLENGDALNIPRYHATVSITGHVFRPISLIAEGSITVESALKSAGGITEFADKDQLYVMRADGSVDSVAQKPSRLKKTTKLLAGDVLIVPEQPMERTLGARLTDALLMSRQLAEIGLLSTQFGKDLDTTLVSPFNHSTSSASDASVLTD